MSSEVYVSPSLVLSKYMLVHTCKHYKCVDESGKGGLLMDMDVYVQAVLQEVIEMSVRECGEYWA